MHSWIRASALWLALCAAQVAYAQTADIPRNVLADSIGQQMEQMPEPKPAQPEKKEDYRAAGAPEGSELVKLDLNQIVVDGSTIFKTEQLQKHYMEYLGRKVLLSDIYVIADRIRQRYHSKGYILTQVFLPPQEIAGGVVRIKVVEGYIGRVRFSGDAAGSKLLRQAAAQIEKERPFRSDTLEEIMLRLNDVPGVEALAALEPLPQGAAEEGAVGLEIIANKKAPNGSVSIDNFASRHLGVWQSNTRSEFYRLFSDTDRISMAYAQSYDPMRLRYGSFEYSLPVHDSGTALSFSANDSFTHPGYLLKDLNVVSRASGFKVGVTQPLIHSRIQTLSVSSEFNMRRQQTDILRNPFTIDRLRTINATVNYSLTDNWGGSNVIQAELVKGLNIFNPTRRNQPVTAGKAARSNARGQHDFTKFAFTASRLQTLSENVGLLASISAQKSSVSLLSSEQFGYGGSTFGKAYNSSELSADEGVALSLELRRNMIWDTWSMQPYLFYDFGYVSDKQYRAGFETAASGGFGFRVNWESLKLDAYLALPLTSRPGTPRLGFEDKDPYIGIAITKSF